MPFEMITVFTCPCPSWARMSCFRSLWDGCRSQHFIRASRRVTDHHQWRSNVSHPRPFTQIPSFLCAQSPLWVTKSSYGGCDFCGFEKVKFMHTRLDARNKMLRLVPRSQREKQDIILAQQVQGPQKSQIGGGHHKIGENMLFVMIAVFTCSWARVSCFPFGMDANWGEHAIRDDHSFYLRLSFLGAQPHL